MRRVFRVIVLALVVAASCGDGGGQPPEDTSSTTTTDGTGTSETPSTTTTIPAGSEAPLDALLRAPVGDPFFDAGRFTMDWADGAHERLVSVDRLPDGSRLAIGDFDLPAAEGLAAEERLVIVWADESPKDVPPFAVALYRLGADGWDPIRVFHNLNILGYLETTTDYQARMPAGPAVLHVFPSEFWWDGDLARMIAGVEVYDDLAATSVVFTGEVDCGITAAAGGCLLISDDGVLRPGDVEDAVLVLEQQLQAIGYLPVPPDTVYDADTEAWVRRFQRDYRLSVDGKVGPETRALVQSLFDGTSGTALAFSEGVSGVSFGSTVESALPQLVGLLGSPDFSVGWEMGACGPTPPYGGWEWYKVTWGGFTAWFTERNGSRQFDGWEVTDLDEIPSNLYFVGGFGPSTQWSQVAAQGGVYDPFYGWWSAGGLGYGMGTFESAPGNPPANNLQVKGFATGSAAVLYDC